MNYSQNYKSGTSKIVRVSNCGYRSLVSSMENFESGSKINSASFEIESTQKNDLDASRRSIEVAHQN